MQNEFPDEIWICKKAGGYNGYNAETAPMPHDVQYHHHRIVEAQQAEIERLREGLTKIKEGAERSPWAREIAAQTLSQTQKESE